MPVHRPHLLADQLQSGGLTVPAAMFQLGSLAAGCGAADAARALPRGPPAAPAGDTLGPHCLGASPEPPALLPEVGSTPAAPLRTDWLWLPAPVPCLQQHGSLHVAVERHARAGGNRRSMITWQIGNRDSADVSRWGVGSAGEESYPIYLLRASRAANYQLATSRTWTWALIVVCARFEQHAAAATAGAAVARCDYAVRRNQAAPLLTAMSAVHGQSFTQTDRLLYQWQTQLTKHLHTRSTACRHS